MSVYKRPGTPYLVYDFSLHGRRFRGSTGATAAAEALEVEARARLAARDELVHGRKPSLTLDQAFGRYWLEHGHRLRGAATVAFQLANLKARLDAGRALESFTDADVNLYVARRRGEVSDSTVNRELGLWRAVVNRARDRWAVQAPALDWQRHLLIEPAPREDGYITPEQAARLIDAAAPWLKAPIRFSLMTGVRLANCVALDWRQVRLRDRIIVFRAKSRRPGGKPLVIDIAGDLLVLLAGLGPREHGPVFTRRGRAIKSWRTAWEGARTRAGLEHVRWHDLRHSCASWMVQSGVPLKVVKDVLGHEDIKTTLRYAHWGPGAKRDALEAAAAMLRRPAEAPVTAGDTETQRKARKTS